MLSSNEKSFIINTFLFIFAFTCILTGIIQHLRLNSVIPFFSDINVKHLHIWTGYLTAIMILFHLILHQKWIAKVSVNILKNRRTLAALVFTVIISLGICFIISTSAPAGKGKDGFQGQRNSGNGYSGSFQNRGR
ncbi:MULTISPECIES: hypothetical protein [Dehalobacter]|uniref:DUF4405 domain-containing protein n=1 Tax=Dehalobacter restrictus TaxID=55583 RepID=A0A857DFX3_9FIRM|nr:MULTISPECIES: hypothetical protein [Dehalobacter]EQB22008.1 hypothetical protein UNSWDHB_669 [Dehalobacter sp. UNSWDHB]QGZ99184.1 hypothetical protein GQ588_00115 [Dehalobacter restrictus]